MEFEIPIVLIVGFAAGYAVRAVISFVRRRKAYRLRHAEALRAAEASNNFRHVQRQYSSTFAGLRRWAANPIPGGAVCEEQSRRSTRQCYVRNSRCT
jgi:hypothetical protein